MMPALTFAEGSLFDAVTNGNTAFIKSYKGDINARDKDGTTSILLS